MNKLASKIMYNCEQVSNFVYDYIDNRLNIITKTRFELHLKACVNCKVYVELYSNAANPSEFLDQNPLPEELKDRTLAFLEKEGILKDPKKEE